MNYRSANNFFEVNMIKDYNSEKMKQITQKEVEFLSRIIHDKKTLCLDVMCGYGRIANGLYDNGYLNVEGIDIGNFGIISEKKQFKFYNHDLYAWNSERKYEFCYSLYNSYPNYTNFIDTLNKCYEILTANGKMVIDIFSKEWRDTIPIENNRIVYEDEKTLVKLNRIYDGINEKSTYVVFDKITNTEKRFSFSQCTITKEKLAEIIPNTWEYYITDSQIEETRTDNQKNILILRKKGK